MIKMKILFRFLPVCVSEHVLMKGFPQKQVVEHELLKGGKGS